VFVSSSSAVAQQLLKGNREIVRKVVWCTRRLDASVLKPLFIVL